ncbi:MAG: winged helix-turn-helix domain-containing protein [Cyanobacteriota bacterium]|nr:winged helix-turn-helix domain-containing protein [Cyanobacteriota bacterium]
MKSAKDIAQMHMLFQAGWSKRRIAARLGMSRNTLDRYLGLTDPRSPSTAHDGSKFDRCLLWLVERGEGGDNDSEILRRRLEKEETLKVSRRTMQRAIKYLREKKDLENEAFIQDKAKAPSNSPSVITASEMTGWRIGPYRLSPSGELTLADSRVQMAEAQKQLLLLFASRPNQMIRQEEIATQLCLQESDGMNRLRSIRLTVHRLRQVFAAGPLGGEVIRSVYGKGYVFNVSVEVMPQADLIRAGMTTDATRPEEGNRGLAQAFGESIIGNPFYSEAHDHWPNRDPYKLGRQETLLQQSVQYDPFFEQGYLELCYTQLLQCFWGMRAAQDVRSALQQQLAAIHHMQHQPAGWLGIKAEVQSLLLWQPTTTQRLYGTWLADTLPRGMPLLAWIRHLIFTGKPKTAVKLLKAHVSDDLCQGWLSLAMAYCAIGQFGAAEEAIQRQLRLEPSMVGTRLFLALVLANRGQSDLATKLIFETGLLDRPFQGVQALVAYTLAQGAHNRRAHQLLDEALGRIKENHSKAAAIAYWGLAALELQRHTEAIQLLKLSIQQRCYSAPVLFSTPFMKAYVNTSAYRLFAEGMRKWFPILA